MRETKSVTIRVLGIDPGSQCTGFGVLDVVGTRLTYVASGVIRTTQGEFAALDACLITHQVAITHAQAPSSPPRADWPPRTASPPWLMARPRTRCGDW